MKSIIKKLVLFFLKALDLALSWLSAPFIASNNGLATHRVGLRKLIGHPVNRYNYYDETNENIERAQAVLKNENIEHFLIPDFGNGVSIGVMYSQKTKALDAIFDNTVFSGYYYHVTKESLNTNLAKYFDFGLNKKTYSSIKSLKLYRHIGGNNQRLIAGEVFGSITLEFWAKPEDLSKSELKKVMDESGITDDAVLKGAIIAPISNKVAKVVAKEEQKRAEVEICGKKYTSIKMFFHNFLGKVDFPIDLVYTWVDGSDPKWLKEFEKYKKKIDPHYTNNSSARYTDHEELRYSLRSVEMFAPWVRNIFIVTAGQRPKWLKEAGNLKIVDHKDIFNSKNALPVFNSHAIETQLHHIKNLSEHYLYVNDDVFFTNPSSPGKFFFSNGIAKLQPSSAPIGTGEPTNNETAPSSAGKNARQIVHKKSGRYITTKFRHTVLPQIKSVAQEIESENNKVYSETMNSKFRSSKDIPFASILMQSYLIASGNGVPCNIGASTINISDKQAPSKLRQFMKDSDNYLTLCLNETITEDNRHDVIHKLTNDFLKHLLPVESKFEKNI
jgi:hypothetical protein